MLGWIVCRAGWLERCQLHPPTVGHLCCNFIGTQLQQWDTITIVGLQNKSTGAPTLLDKSQFGSVVCFDLIRGGVTDTPEQTVIKYILICTNPK